MTAHEGDDHGQYRRTPAPAPRHTAPSPGLPHAGAQAAIAAHIAAAFVAADAEVSRTIEDAGIRAGEITAWRAWRVREGRLYSVYMESCEWRPGKPMMAIGAIGEYCGVHAFKDRGRAENYLMMHTLNQIEAAIMRHYIDGFALGTVDLWGEVIEHQDGYRAEFAQVASLDQTVGFDLDALRARYGV